MGIRPIKVSQYTVAIPAQTSGLHNSFGSRFHSLTNSTSTAKPDKGAMNGSIVAQKRKGKNPQPKCAEFESKTCPIGSHRMKAGHSLRRVGVLLLCPKCSTE